MDITNLQNQLREQGVLKNSPSKTNWRQKARARETLVEYGVAYPVEERDVWLTNNFIVLFTPDTIKVYAWEGLFGVVVSGEGDLAHFRPLLSLLNVPVAAQKALFQASRLAA